MHGTVSLKHLLNFFVPSSSCALCTVKWDNKDTWVELITHTFLLQTFLVLYIIRREYHKRFETWSWRRIESFSWTDQVKNAEVLHTVKQEHPTHIKKRKANWIGHILRRNGLLEHAIEGDIEGTSRRGRRGKQLLDDLNEGQYPELETGSTRSHSVKDTLWEKLWTCLKTDYVMM